RAPTSPPPRSTAPSSPRSATSSPPAGFAAHGHHRSHATLPVVRVSGVRHRWPWGCASSLHLRRGAGTSLLPFTLSLSLSLCVCVCVCSSARELDPEG
uniref:Uncharacterized protein n=1 Tax=Triticum urartu TaxID=4572 RepID=A0A8R7P6T2_TRIUA